MKAKSIIKVLGIGFFGVPICIVVGESLEMKWVEVMMWAGLMILAYFYTEKDQNETKNKA